MNEVFALLRAILMSDTLDGLVECLAQFINTDSEKIAIEYAKTHLASRVPEVVRYLELIEGRTEDHSLVLAYWAIQDTPLVTQLMDCLEAKRLASRFKQECPLVTQQRDRNRSSYLNGGLNAWWEQP